MSAAARWVLGLASLGFSGMCVYLILAGLIPQNPWIMWIIAAICLMITIACVPGRHGYVFGRVLAGISGGVCAAYLITEIFHPDPYKGRSAPSLGGALALFMGWGLPAIYYAFGGSIPGQSRLGEVAGAITRHDRNRALEPKSHPEEEEPELH